MSLRRIVVIGVLALIVLLFFNGGAFIFAEDVEGPKSGPHSGSGGDGGPHPFAPAGTGSRFTGCTSGESAWALVVWRSKQCAFPLLPFGAASGPTEV